MGIYGNNANIDPGTGAVGGSFPPPGHGSGARWFGPSRDWSPPADLESQDPADCPYATGEKPSFGPTIEDGIERSADEDWDGGDGFDSGDFDESNDGDDDPHDADCDFDCDSHVDGPVADNIRSVRPRVVVTMPTLGRRW